MCGISAWITKNNPNKEKFIKYNDSIAHRGPDANAIEFYKIKDTYVSFGHRRLSIIDLSEVSNQPFHDNNYTIIFNGEIYNYLEIKEELELNGIEFCTLSDTEVLLKSYIYWGKKCLDKFNGMFSFLILNKEKQEMFLARDRFGIKPLYYYVNENKEIFFASEIKQIITLDSYNPIGNINTIANFLENRYIDYSEETFFRNIFQIVGGEAAIIDLISLNVKKYKWYDINNTKLSTQHSKKIFFDIFKSSIQLRLRSDVEIGSCLSGGIDSSSIVCLADEDLDYKNDYSLKTFTSSFEDKRFDEREYVDITKQQTSIKSTYLFPKSKDFFNQIERLVYIHDEPIWSTSIFAQNQVFKSAKNENVKVMLDGQGADEVFCGYISIFYPTYFNNLNIFEQLKKIIYGANKKTVLKMLLKQFFPKKQKMNKIIFKKFENKFQGNFKSLKEHTRFFIKYHLPALLHYEDRNSMAYSIEARLPFLDYRLVEFGYNMPDSLKVKDGLGKVLIRDAMRGITPDAILDNKNKKGFITPQKIWIGENISLINKQINKLGNFEFIDKSKLKYNLDNLNNKKYDEGLIMRLYSLSKWIDVFNIKEIK